MAHCPIAVDGRASSNARHGWSATADVGSCLCHWPWWLIRSGDDVGVGGPAGATSDSTTKARGPSERCPRSVRGGRRARAPGGEGGVRIRAPPTRQRCAARPIVTPLRGLRCGVRRSTDRDGAEPPSSAVVAAGDTVGGSRSGEPMRLAFSRDLFLSIVSAMLVSRFRILRTSALHEPLHSSRHQARLASPPVGAMPRTKRRVCDPAPSGTCAQPRACGSRGRPADWACACSRGGSIPLEPGTQTVTIRLVEIGAFGEAERVRVAG